MSIRSERDLKGLRAIGRIVRRALDAMTAAVRADVSTAELNEKGARVLAEEGARSAPPMVYGFPMDVCISVNEEAIHGIPGRRVLRDGDLVKLDLVAEKDGFYADAAVTVAVGVVSETADLLMRTAKTAFQEGARAARVGNRVYDIGRAVEREVTRRGFAVLRELGGHGVGRTIHEAPSVPNYFEPRSRGRLTEGLVLTIEPIIAAGGGRSRVKEDGWTVVTEDRSWAAHYEQTVVVTRGAPMVVTA